VLVVRLWWCVQQEQCAVLLASSFMGTLWVHPALYSQFKWPRFEVQDLFTNRQGPSVAILRMVLHYFERLSIEGLPSAPASAPDVNKEGDGEN
jgi:hypothetical protein